MLLLTRRGAVFLVGAVLASGVAAVPGVASALSGPTAGSGAAQTLPRPVVDTMGRRGARAPISGVVPGLTGSAAQAEVGSAAAHFREATRHRLDKAGQTSSAAGGTGTAVSHAASDATSYGQLHNDWGVDVANSTRATGLFAMQSVVPNARALSGGDYVYAPTAIPAGGACIEVTTAYYGGGAVVWAWDWCGGRDGPLKIVRIDSSFLSTYTTTVNGHPAYALEEHRTDASSNTWTAYLYNYSSQAWETFYTSSGSFDIPQYSFGWNIFEIYSSVNQSTGQGYYCGDMAGQTFESSGSEILIDGNWTAVTGSNSYLSRSRSASGRDYDCSGLSFNVVNANDHWTAKISS